MSMIRAGKYSSVFALLTVGTFVSGCGFFGSVNQNPNSYSNWVADYSTRGTVTGATPSNSAQPALTAPVASTTSYQPAPLVAPVATAQPLGTQPVVVEPLTSEVIVEPVTIEPVATQPAMSAGQQSQPVAVAPVATAPSVSKGSASSAVGNWLWPVDGGKLFRAYNPGSTGSKGALISGAIGATVRATNSGEVVYVGQNLPGLGSLIIISHANNIASGYGHVGSIAVEEGQSVKQGQAIAKLEGVNIKEPVIHFEIRQNNQAVNPISYLQSQ